MHACTNTDTHTHTHIARTTWILEIIIGSAWVAQVLALRVGRAGRENSHMMPISYKYHGSQSAFTDSAVVEPSTRYVAPNTSAS